MILQQAQAKALYDALCALNNISGIHTEMKTDFPGLEGHVYFNANLDGINVNVYNKTSQAREDYESQADFCAAYGIDC